MKLKNVVERRQRRDLNFHKKAWDDKVTSLFETPAEEMVKKKLMYEERRKFIRGTLEMQRRRKKARKVVALQAPNVVPPGLHPDAAAPKALKGILKRAEVHKKVGIAPDHHRFFLHAFSLRNAKTYLNHQETLW